MMDFIGSVFENLQLILDSSPLFRWVLGVSISLSLFLSVCRVFSRVFFYDEYSLFDGLGFAFLSLIKKCVAAVLRYFRCFNLLYKFGLAVEGVDFVNCDVTECGSCPFSVKCPDNKSLNEVDL